MKHSRGAWVGRIVVIALAVAAVLAYLLVPAVKSTLDGVFAMFASGDFSAVSAFMESYGPLAAVVSFLLMVFQSVIAPLPAFFITIANANLFGWWQGAILSWISAMVGAVVCFFIARILGQEVVEKLISKAGLQAVDDFFKRYGTQSVLIARLLPFMSFDFVSYFAGLTSMPFLQFIVATGLGQLPATLVYSYVGGMLTGGAQMLMTGLLVLFALGVLVALLRSVYVERRKKADSAVGVGVAGVAVEPSADGKDDSDA